MKYQISKYCGVMKQADMPSCLGGGDTEQSKGFFQDVLPNCPLEVRILLLQQSISIKLTKKGRLLYRPFFIPIVNNLHTHCIHFLTHSFYLLIGNVLVVCHYLINNSIWCYLDDSIRNRLHKLMVMRTQHHRPFKIFQ